MLLQPYMVEEVENHLWKRLHTINGEYLSTDIYAEIHKMFGSLSTNIIHMKKHLKVDFFAADTLRCITIKAPELVLSKIVL